MRAHGRRRDPGALEANRAGAAGGVEAQRASSFLAGDLRIEQGCAMKHSPRPWVTGAARSWRMRRCAGPAIHSRQLAGARAPVGKFWQTSPNSKRRGSHT